jgi:HemY protein
MIRTVIFLAVLAGLAFLSMFLADRPGSILINWDGYRIQASFVTIVVALVFVLGAAWLLARFWSWVKGGTPLSPERRALRRKQKGLNEVDGALSALAAGDSRKALSLGQSAVKHLEGAGIAYIVAAQAATASGKDALAEEYFEALSQTQHGKFLGLRGRVSEARRLGRVSKALELSEEALKEAPRSDWALATAFELEAKLGKWTDAQETLRKATAKSIFDSDTSARHLGAIRYGQALAAQKDGKMADAVRYAKQALSVRADFVPAAVLAAQLFKSSGKIRQASSVIEKTWKLRPHPALAESYAALMPMETSKARLTRFQKLAKLAPDHSESHLRLAEAALGANDYEAAEAALKPCLDGMARARAGVIMGQIAAAKGADARARTKWADLAAKGAPEPSYECSVCRAQRTYWTSHCPSCDSFNSFVWDEPAAGPGGPVDADPLRLVGAAPARLAAAVDAAPPKAPLEPAKSDVIAPSPAQEPKVAEAETVDAAAEPPQDKPEGDAGTAADAQAAGEKPAKV